MWRSLLFALPALAVGCASCDTDSLGVPGPTLIEAELADGAELHRPPTRKASEDERERAALCPIVDVHIHTFNARYLPLQNILLGKRDKTPLGVLLGDRWAKSIAAAIVGTTELTPIDAASKQATLERWERREDTVALECHRSFGDPTAAQDALDQSCVRTLQRVSNALRPLYAALESDGRLSEETRVALRLAGVDAQLERELSKEDRSELRRALGRLTDYLAAGSARDLLGALITPDGDIEARFHRDYGDVIDLCVSHSMDLAPTYAQVEDGKTLLMFESQQLPRLDHFQQQKSSRMLYFVAYNPFRDNGGRGGDALRIVREAIAEKGAYGIKLYPPSGYRPSHNRIPPRIRTLLTKEPMKQWDFRYAGVSGEDLDARLGALFDLCLEHDLPIFVHCHTGEFEARRGYGECMSDPRWWRSVLAERPKLRVCFGHAGGEDFWFGSEDEHEDWGRLVYELCVTYENVYCEFGVLHELVGAREREHFKNILLRLFETPRGTYPFETKLMYGSDWYMPGSGEQRQVELRAWQATFLHADLIRHYPAFFCGNALRYLDVERRIGVTAAPDAVVVPLHGVVADRLRKVRERFVALSAPRE